MELTNDPHGNLAFVKALARDRLQVEPRPVASVGDILGGFSQSRILVAEKFTGELQCINAGGAFSVQHGRSDQSAGYVFSLENGHGLSASIFGDGKIEVTLLSQDSRKVQVDFDGLAGELRRLESLDQGPFYRVPKG